MAEPEIGVNDRTSPGELLATKYRTERPDGEGPEGTLESVLRSAKMLDTYAPDCFPANELGQIHFARAMMETTVDEIRAYLPTIIRLRDGGAAMYAALKVIAEHTNEMPTRETAVKAMAKADGK